MIVKARCNGKEQLTVNTVVDHLLAINDSGLFCPEDQADRLFRMVWLAMSHTGVVISGDKEARTIDTADGAHFAIYTPRDRQLDGSPMGQVKGLDLSEAECWFDDFTHVNCGEEK